MPEGVAGDAFVDACGTSSSPNGLLQAAFIQMVAPYDARTWVGRKMVGGGDVLPDPFAAGVGILTVERVGQIDGAEALSQVFFVEELDAQARAFHQPQSAAI